VQPAVGDPAWAGGWTGWPTEVPANPYYSVILWSLRQTSSQHGILHQIFLNASRRWGWMGCRRETRTLAVPPRCPSHGKLLRSAGFPAGPSPSSRRAPRTDRGALNVFPQRPRKHLHWKSHFCVGLRGANELFHHEAEKSWGALSWLHPQKQARRVLPRGSHFTSHLSYART